MQPRYFFIAVGICASLHLTGTCIVALLQAKTVCECDTVCNSMAYHMLYWPMQLLFVYAWGMYEESVRIPAYDQNFERAYACTLGSMCLGYTGIAIVQMILSIGIAVHPEDVCGPEYSVGHPDLMIWNRVSLAYVAFCIIAQYVWLATRLCR